MRLKICNAVFWCMWLSAGESSLSLWKDAIMLIYRKLSKVILSSSSRVRTACPGYVSTAVLFSNNLQLRSDPRRVNPRGQYHISVPKIVGWTILAFWNRVSRIWWLLDRRYAEEMPSWMTIASYWRVLCFEIIDRMKWSIALAIVTAVEQIIMLAGTITKIHGDIVKNAIPVATPVATTALLNSRFIFA